MHYIKEKVLKYYIFSKLQIAQLDRNHCIVSRVALYPLT